MPQNENSSCQLESHQPNLGPMDRHSPDQKARLPGVKSLAGSEPDCLTVLIFLKMECILVPKYTQVFQNLAPSPTYLHTSDSRGKNNPLAIHLLQGLLASLYIFFTVELFLILVPAQRNMEQQWLGDVWKPCQAKQCLKVCLGSANLVKVYFNFTKKHLQTLVS